MSQHDIMGPASCVVSHESAALHTARHMQEMSDRIERKGLFFMQKGESSYCTVGLLVNQNFVAHVILAVQCPHAGGSRK